MDINWEAANQYSTPLISGTIPWEVKESLRHVTLNLAGKINTSDWESVMVEHVFCKDALRGSSIVASSNLNFQLN